MPFRLPKHSKLCGQMPIARLYKEGRKFVSWPIRVTWLPAQEETKVLVWAPKSLFKKAVQRNHLRRLMREAFRLNQSLLGEQKVWIAFNYMDKEPKDYATIEKAIQKALKNVAA